MRKTSQAMQKGEGRRTRADVFSSLGLARIPWVIRVYLVLVSAFGALVLLSVTPLVSGALLSLASDGLKMVLAALLGALSQAGESRLSAGEEEREGS